MSRAFAPTLMALVVSLLVLQAAPALAEPANGKATPVYVLSIWTNDVDDQADALTQALRLRVRQVPSWSLSETNQSFETLEIALRCPPTPNQACLDRIGEQLHADHYVWGTLAKEKAGEVTAELRLWSRGKPQVEASESYSETLKDPADEALRAVAGRLFARLTNTSNTGALVVHAGNASGSVLVDGTTRGKLENGVAHLEVPAGAHSITLRVSGYTAPGQTVTLQDGGSQDVSFTLSPSAGLQSPVETVNTSADRTPKKGASARKIVGYTAMGLSVLGLVVGGMEGAAWLSDKNASDKDRSSVPQSVTDVCNPGMLSDAQAAAAAADACSKSKHASSAAAVGWASAGVGAALLVAGIVLVVGDHSGEEQVEAARATYPKPKLEFLPAFGPKGGNVDVRLTF